MSLARALLLNVLLYVSLIWHLLWAIPTLVLPRRFVMAYIRGWGHYYIWLCRVVGGIKLEIRNRERIPKGPLLIAAKHQSIWETFALLSLLDDPCFILKRELVWIPLFGWYALKSRMLPVNRKGGGSVMTQLNAKAREEVRRDAGRQILFFPEGTRRPAGAPAAYRHGVSHIYESLGVTCVPIALNAGLYWPRRSLKLNPGTVLVEVLEPIPAGLPRDEFFPLMQERIETASNRLLEEGIAELGQQSRAAIAARKAASMGPRD
jgi:1-acyl-sn-glycerol-3-phosphate acyltransferase